MDRNIKRNYLYNLAYQLLILVVPLITSPYISRVLGPENIGIYSYTSTVVSYFVLFASFSFQTYGVKQIARVQNDVNERSQLFFEIQVKKLIFCVIAVIAYLVFFVFQREYYAVYLVQILTIISSFFDISYFFQGLEEYKVTVIRNAIVKLIGAVLTFVFIRSRSDLLLYVVIQTVIVFLGNLSLWIELRKKIDVYCFHRFSLGNDTKQLIELFIPVISVQMYFSIDKIMLGMLDPTKAENGYYEQALKIIRICQTIITSLGGVLIPSVSRMIATDSKDKVNETIYSSIRVGFLLACPMCFGLIAISDVFVPWFYGPGYERTILIMSCLSPILIFSSISNILSNGILIPASRHNYVSVSTVSAACLNILLNLLLIPKYKAVGAAIASVASELLVLILNTIFSKGYFKIKSLKDYCFKYLFTGVVMLFTIRTIMIFVSGINLTILVFMLVLIGAIVYFGILLICKDDFCLGFITKAINRIK